MRFIFFVFIEFIVFCANAQDNGSSILDILNNVELKYEYKKQKIDSLLKNSPLNKENDSLFKDTYEIIKWYFGNNKAAEAIKLNQWNLRMMESVDYPQNLFFRKNLYSLGYYQMINEDFINAHSNFSKVININSSDNLTAFSLYQMASIYYKQYDYVIAAEFYEEAFKLSKELNNSYVLTNSSIYGGLCYKHLKGSKNLGRGIRLLNKAIAFEKDNNENPDDINFIAGLNSLHRHLGNLYIDREDYNLEKAKLNYDLALKYARLVGDSLRLADIHHELGNYYIYDNLSHQAIFHLNKSLSFNPDASLITYVYKNKSRYYFLQNDFISAKKEIQNALKVQLPGKPMAFYNTAPKVNFADALNKFDLLDILINKAIIAYYDAKENSDDTVKLEKALELIDNADYLLDELRLNTNELKTKLFWKNIFSELYTIGVAIAYELKIEDKAFYYMEKNKAILLREDIDRRKRVEQATIPEDIMETYKRLKRETEQSQLVNDDTSVNTRLLAKQKFNEFLENLDQEYKDVFKQSESIDIIDLKEFQNSINIDNQVYIHYILHDDFLHFENKAHGYGLLIEKNKTKFFKIDGIKRLKAELNEFSKGIKAPITNKLAKQNQTSLSYELFRKLIPESIKEEIQGKVITIIADNYLQNIPFEALNTSTKKDDYLIKSNEINYAYSLSFLSENQSSKHQNLKNAVGFAPVTFNDSLPKLGNTKSEVEQLNTFQYSKLFISDSASKHNLKSHLRDYKIIHIATHSSANKKDEPYLVLSDSTLNLKELYSTKNSAELVVLSACETADGELYKGEGVMSLTRGFFNTGAGSVTSSLWTIDDKATSEIMSVFYKNLKDGQTKSRALHNAKLNYLDNHKLSETSPYYWASFILIGDTSKIEFTQDYTLYYIIGCVVIILMILIFFLKKKKLG